MISNGSKSRALPALRIELQGKVKLFLHGRQDQVNMNSDISLILPSVDPYFPEGQETTAYISMTETTNDDNVMSLSEYQKKCRYPHEREHLQLPTTYSQSNCMTDCRYKRQLQICNCSIHTMPYSDPNRWCRSYDEILCLHNHADRFHAFNKVTKGLVPCYCDYPSCLESDIAIVHKETIEVRSSHYPRINILLMKPPYSVYKRTVVRGKLDLVVSIGGAASLFVGASLLSACELIYFFTVRVAVNNHLKQKENAPCDGEEVNLAALHF